jgi:type I restriction enzyme S subunit
MKLGDVITLSKGNLISIEDDKEYIIAGVQNYGAGILNKRKVKGIELTMKKYQLIKPNQLMWCKVDTKNGAFGITKIEHTNSLASTNMALANIDTSKCHPEFLEYLFRISFFHEIITKASSGTTNRKYLTPTQLFENIDIPDFNKDEQLEWLKKVDSIINSGISNEITHQLTLVKKLRQQLLQDAVQGKLVKQDKNDEPASELLKKIKLEKQKLIAEKVIKQGKLQEAEKQEELLFNIPANWVWCNLDEICRNITDGTHQTPTYTQDGIPFISAQHVKPFKFTPDKRKYVSYEAYLECIKNKKPEIGDILITRVGAIGEAAAIEQQIDFAFYVSLGLIQPFINLVNSRYIVLVINSPYGNAYSKGNVSSKGSSAGNYNLGRLRSFNIPLPPLAEQNRIVQKLDELMQYCDDLEASIKESEIQNSTLLQQVLREALRPAQKNTNKKSAAV